jgi:ABC-type transporter Mla subunit MlaD|tara:strand:- start:333 stop:524 length:192 start_codon:yes stop_codon:yes gene_type:complete
MENEVTNLLDNMAEQFQEALHDADKFTSGNNSAGTRVRKAMQNIKNLAQQVRIEVQSQKNVEA